MERKKKNGRQGEGGGRRPTSLTERQIIEVEALAAMLSIEQISDYFGISHEGFATARKLQPEVERAYRRGKAKATVAIAQSLIKKARSGDVKAQQFYLKTQGGWKSSDGPETVINNYPADIVHKVEFIDKDEKVD